jgi:hypothetical protein
MITEIRELAQLVEYKSLADENRFKTGFFRRKSLQFRLLPSSSK